MKQYPDLRPRALSGTRGGVSMNGPRPRFRPHFHPRARCWAIVARAMPRGEPNRTRRLLLRVYRRLRARYGHAGWWPGESSFEVCVGAILVQNTAWANVERTLASLRRRGLLSFAPLHRRSPSRLAPLLRSSGTFRVKARRLRAFLDFLGSEYGGRVEAMARGGSGAPAPEAPRGRRHRPRDRRLDRALRRGAPGLRRGRVHPPRVLAPGPPSGPSPSGASPPDILGLSRRWARWRDGRRPTTRCSTS